MKTNEESAKTPTELTEINEEKQDSVDDETESQNTAEAHIPTKEEVLVMREQVLEGMSEEEIERLTENIKVANLQMESAYLNDDIFEKLEDAESPFWNYFDEKGEIQIGGTYEGDYQQMRDIMKREKISEEEFYENVTAKMFLLYFCTVNKIYGKISAMSNTNIRVFFIMGYFIFFANFVVFLLRVAITVGLMSFAIAKLPEERWR